MSALVVSLTLVLVTLFGVFAHDLAEAATLRARAQTAADAAALAAVQESGPYGGGDPRAAAARFAGLNGARLVACACERGAIEMQVTVLAGDVVARARAVLDVALIAPRAAPPGAAGMQPRLVWALDRLLAAAGGKVSLVSGFRSAVRQAQLWEEALARYGTPEAADDWVAPPGSSMHQRGLAADLGGDLELAVRLIEELQLPLYRPLTNEPWHFELLGSRG